MRRAVYFRIFIVVFFLLFYPALLYTRTYRMEHISRYLIPLYVLGLFLSVVLSYGERRNRNLLVFGGAFFCILLGDLIINLTPCTRCSFLFFSLTHILLGLYYLRDCRRAPYQLPLFVAAALLSLLLIFLNVAAIQSAMLRLAMVLYFVLLAFMLWRAGCYLFCGEKGKMQRWLIFGGSALFYLTDVFVLYNQVHGMQSMIFWIWLVYPPALAALSAAPWFSDDGAF